MKWQRPVTAPRGNPHTPLNQSRPSRAGRGRGTSEGSKDRMGDSRLGALEPCALREVLSIVNVKIETRTDPSVKMFAKPMSSSLFDRLQKQHTP